MRRLIAAWLAALLFLCSLLGGCGGKPPAAPDSEADTSFSSWGTGSTPSGTVGSDSAGPTTAPTEPSGGATGEVPGTTASVGSVTAGSEVNVTQIATTTRSPVAATTTTAVEVSVVTRPSVTKPSSGTTTTAALPPEDKPVQQSLTPVSPEQYYGYRQLTADGDKSMLELYRRLAAAVDGVETEVEVYDLRLNAQQCQRVFQYYADDYPQHFWRENRFGYTAYQGDPAVLSIMLSYYFGGDKTQIAIKKRQVDAELASLLEGVTGSMSAFERERILHDRLIKRVTYDLNAGAHIRSLYGTLVEGKAVCEGYARTLQRLLYLAGIPCLIVRGTGNGEAHAWNMVQLEGQWYQVDATWNDAPNFPDGLHYQYFNLTTAAISADHRIVQEAADGYPVSYPVPTATATVQNYFVKNKLVWSAFDVDAVAAGIRTARDSGLTHMFCRVTGDSNAFLRAYQSSLAALKRKSGVSIPQSGVSISTIPGSDVMLIAIQ